MNTLDQVRTKAKQTELAACNFLGKDGKIARDRRKWVKVELIFVDGEKMYAPRLVADTDAFDQLQFRLRPSQNHS